MNPLGFCILFGNYSHKQKGTHSGALLLMVRLGVREPVSAKGADRGKFCEAKLSFSTALLLKKKSSPRVAFPSKVLLMLQHYISLREFDIITKKCIIEVKSGKKPKGLVQFLGQKRYAESRNKRHIVFAPNISIAAKKSHEQSGITIVKDYKLLIETVKEHEK